MSLAFGTRVFHIRVSEARALIVRSVIEGVSWGEFSWSSVIVT